MNTRNDNAGVAHGHINQSNLLLVGTLNLYFSRGTDRLCGDL